MTTMDICDALVDSGAAADEVRVDDERGVVTYRGRHIIVRDRDVVATLPQGDGSVDVYVDSNPVLIADMVIENVRAEVENDGY